MNSPREEKFERVTSHPSSPRDGGEKELPDITTAKFKVSQGMIRFSLNQNDLSSRNLLLVI